MLLLLINCVVIVRDSLSNCCLSYYYEWISTLSTSMFFLSFNLILFISVKKKLLLCFVKSKLIGMDFSSFARLGPFSNGESFVRCLLSKGMDAHRKR